MDRIATLFGRRFCFLPQCPFPQPLTAARITILIDIGAFLSGSHI
jgi:hypothetical protein